MGQLQRGTGAGYVQALAASTSAAHDALLECLRHDPRWDWQLDTRDDYYARLIEGIGLPLDEVGALLAGDGVDAEPESNPRLWIGVLSQAAIRGSSEAGRLLREYVSNGDMWDTVVDDLTFGYWRATVPVQSWDAMTGLDGVILTRFASDTQLRDALDRACPDWREPPWLEWRSRHERMAEMADELTSTRIEPPKSRAESRRTPFKSWTTGELLMSTDLTIWRLVGMELGSRTDVDLDALREAARRADSPSREAALLALGLQGDPVVVELAEQIVQSAEPGRLHAALRDALTALPPNLTSDLVDAWLESDAEPRRRKAAAILAEHAAHSHREQLRTALDAELDRELAGDQYVVCSLSEALGRLPEGGPYAELDRAFREMPYSYGRRFVAEALAATDPGFGAGLACDCLFDCEPETRLIGVEHVRLQADADERVRDLAADPFQEKDVRTSAEGRLRL